jgi:hypothetical protein
MFDLNLAHIQHAERERELMANLRVREILKATVASTAIDPAVIRPAAPPLSATRVRALGR